MGKNTSVVLGEAQEVFIKRQIASGRFGSASEAMREALTLLEERELKLEALRRAIDEGDASGPGEPFDIVEFLAEQREWHLKSA
ncbi:MAG: type II toxin-antitoxin system ParD family antitoxin [Rhizobiaceae bacterium]